MKKRVETLQKTNVIFLDVIFNKQNSHLQNVVLTDRRNLLGTRQKSACGKSSSFLQFSFSVARNAIAKATEYVTFGFPFRILVFFPCQESLNVTFCKRYVLSSVVVAIIRRLRRLFLNLTEGRERRVTCQELIGDIKHVKNTILFHVCCYGFSQGWRSLYNTVVYMINHVTTF